MGASLQDFADGLSQYPIPDTGGIPLRNGFEEGDDHATEVVTMRLQPFGTGNRGQVYVEVELTNQPGVPLPGGGTNCAATLTRKKSSSSHSENAGAMPLKLGPACGRIVTRPSKP